MAEIRSHLFGYEGASRGWGNMAGAHKSLAMQEDYFFVGGSGWVNPELPNGATDNFLTLYAFNHNLDSLWSINIGYDAYYTLYSIAPTPDGGCVLGATRFDWRQGDDRCEAYIVKIAKPDITSIHTPNPDERNFIVYPNPGNNQIFIETDVTFFHFRLFDMQGRLQIATENEKIIDVGQLSKDVYLYQIIDKKGHIKRGKWIKS